MTSTRSDHGTTSTAQAARATIGRGVPRIGGIGRVTGEQVFVADIKLDGMLHVKLVTIDVAHARIVRVRVDRAVATPGVVDVITTDDLPDPMPRFGPVYRDRPILADGVTRYHGEPVAAVVAESVYAAEVGAALVEVEFDTLPAVVSIEQALAPDAPLVQDPAIRPNDPRATSNVLQERHYGWDEDGIDTVAADLVIEQTYTFPMVTHFSIEPHGFIAAADDERIILWSAVQHPYLLQRMMAELFDLPLSQVRVIAPDPGGGFGGKQNPKLEPLLIVASRRNGGRPCRLVLTLEQSFQAVRRAAATIKVRTGFNGEGRILYQDVHADYLIGAYADIAERVMTKSAYLACGPYRTPRARIRARAILSHTTPSTAFRGFGAPQMIWAIEGQIDAAARALGLDGRAIRLVNVATTGDEILRDDVPADGDWPASVRRAAAVIGWDDALPEGHGRGMAVGIKAGATTGMSNSMVRLLADGSAMVYAGTSDMGQGARTIFGQLVADALGISLAGVRVIMGDTSAVPFDLQTSASRSTVFMGNAISRACDHILEQLRELAADHYAVPAAAVHMDGPTIVAPTESVPVAIFVQNHLRALGGEIVGIGRYRKLHDEEHPLGGTPAFFEFNCTAFEVSVDIDTGEVTIHKHVTVSDVGRALNPLQVRSQDEGAAIMGLGHSLMERVVVDDLGRIRNLGAIDYRIPSILDLPGALVTDVVENADGPGPYGSKGMSEGALLPTAPALAAAIADATGVVITDLPITAERLWCALRDRAVNLTTGS